MRTKPIGTTAVLLAVMALAVSAVAKPINKTISIPQPAKIGLSRLDAGEYRLSVDGTKVTVQKGKQVVAEVEGRWEQRDQKTRSNSVLLGSSGEVQEIRFAGESRVLVLSPSQP